MRVTNWFKRQRNGTKDRTQVEAEVHFQRDQQWGTYGQLRFHAHDRAEKLVVTMNEDEFRRFVDDVNRAADRL